MTPQPLKPAHRISTAPLRLVERIVVPIEGSDREYLAQTWAVELAASLGLSIRAVHVRTGLEPEPGGLFAYIREEGAKWDVPVETAILDGTDAASEILAELTSRDLVVVGTQRLAGKYEVGSVARELVRHSPCPVQLVRLS